MVATRSLINSFSWELEIATNNFVEVVVALIGLQLHQEYPGAKSLLGNFLSLAIKGCQTCQTPQNIEGIQFLQVRRMHNFEVDRCASKGAKA